MPEFAQKNDNEVFVDVGCYIGDTIEESEGTGSKFVTGKSSDEESLTKIVALDDFIEEGFSFLKADVESYEYQVIMGASKTIQKCKPKMAICLYHNVFDFIQLPGIIKDLVPDYRLYLRQHAASWFDTVVYAVDKAQP